MSRISGSRKNVEVRTNPRQGLGTRDPAIHSFFPVFVHHLLADPQHWDGITAIFTPLLDGGGTILGV